MTHAYTCTDDYNMYVTYVHATTERMCNYMKCATIKLMCNYQNYVQLSNSSATSNSCTTINYMCNYPFYVHVYIY